MKFEAILFDCDGVLVDSEPIVNTVLRDMLEERGWVMSFDACMRHFVGRAVRTPTQGNALPVRPGRTGSRWKCNSP